MEIPRCYKNWAMAMIDSFWNKPLDKGQTPFMSKAQVRQQIRQGIAQMQEQDGSPSDWTHCEHCDGTGMYVKIGPDKTQIGVVGQPDQIETEALCYQCYGKGRQSAADRKRNWGYRKMRDERNAYA